MTKPLSEICQDYLEDEGCQFVRVGCPGRVQACKDYPITACHHCDHAADYEVVGCQRPSDDVCPALTKWLDRQVDDCDGCDELTRYDPSPPGVSLPAGWMYECRVDAEPGRCPQKDLEDDFPSECQKGGEQS